MIKKWHLADKVNKVISEQFPEINPIILQLLFNRGLVSEEKIEEFLQVDYHQHTLDPFLFNDMETAVSRILRAVELREKIVIYGDYDADGVTSTAVLAKTLEALGANFEVYIPFRETEGYGLNKEAISSIASMGASLIVTVDCGISNKNEVAYATELGVEVIITDHHLAPEKVPSAYAILNPNVPGENYPFKHLTGCGVAFKLVQALLGRQHDFKVVHLHEGWEKWLLDLVAIGTIADMQPLLGENRVFAKYGLVVANKQRNPGLAKLVNSIGSKSVKIDEITVGWQISPRLNAAGRLNHANIAYELLFSTDEKRVDSLVEELNQTNRNRQVITEKITSESEILVSEIKDKRLLAIVGEGWPKGIVGLVAGRICDKYNLPTLVISKVNGEIIGSGRSIPEFNIVKAITKCQENLSRFGGHAQACGFTVKSEADLQEFIKKMLDYAETELANLDLTPVLTVDAELSLVDVNWELLQQLEKFPPYGESNPKPLFLIKNLTVANFDTVGKDNGHLRLMVADDNGLIKKTIGFSFGHWAQELQRGDIIDMVFEIDVNEWNGTKELQLKIIDLQKNESNPAH